VEILIPLALLFLFFWFFVLLPQRRRRSDHSRMQDAIAPGDEIITAGGLHGEVVEIDETVLRIEIAPGTVVRVDRRAVAARVEPDDDDPADDETGEPVSREDADGTLPLAEHADDVTP
jgi:preprotein translocase subunit YajC